MSELTRCLVLVDDNASILKLHASLFSQWYRVRSYASGPELLKEIDDLDPVGFILDWMMPGMNGLELCRRLRADSRFDLAPVAFFTAVDPSAESLEKVFAAGGQLFLSKGTNTAAMLSQVFALVKSYQKLQEQLRLSGTMLSVIRHDFANALTGIVTGVEVMGMHKAFADPGLAHQLDAVQASAGHLRELLTDMGQVLRYEPRLPGVPAPTDGEEIVAACRVFLDGVRDRIPVSCDTEKRLYLPRDTVARLLYHLLRYCREACGSETAIRADVSEVRHGLRLRVEVEAPLVEEIRFAFLDPLEDAHWEMRGRALPIQFVRNTIDALRASLSVESSGGWTRILVDCSPGPPPPVPRSGEGRGGGAAEA